MSASARACPTGLNLLLSAGGPKFFAQRPQVPKGNTRPNLTIKIGSGNNALNSSSRPLGRGVTANISKGTVLPRNLREQLAFEQVAANPTSGQMLKLTMKDVRWPASDGWVKMQQIVQSGGREGSINVHYVYNTCTKQIDDIKIVLPGVR